MNINPEKTAIHRTSCSRPTRLAVNHNIITKDTTVLDYGCGRGADVAYLNSLGINCVGWDPFYSPNHTPKKSDVVLLNYVLNVIVAKKERDSTLQKALALTKHILVVAVRVEKLPVCYTPYKDGHLTKKGTFQKFYTQDEFQAYLEAVTHYPVQVIEKGVVYIQKT